jgi:hypothetical protein
MTPSIFHGLTLSVMNAMSRIRGRRCALAITLILCCAGFVIRAHSALRSESRHSKPPAATHPTSPPVAQGNQRGPVQVVRFALYDVGIYPREAHVAKGIVAVSIEDLSGGAVGLEIERETGNAPERVGGVSREVYARGRSDIRLEPGRYRVYMTDHPANQAVLVVEQ